jgi:hypothetical protein
MRMYRSIGRVRGNSRRDVDISRDANFAYDDRGCSDSAAYSPIGREAFHKKASL